MNKKLSVLVFFPLMLCLSFFSSSISVAQSTEQSLELRNYSHPNPVEAQWDVKYNYNLNTITGALGNAGVVYIPTLQEFWVSRWNSGLIFRVSRAGVSLGSFTTTGFTGTRGLTWDGQFVWAGNATNNMFRIDPVTRLTVATIPLSTTPNVQTRFITFDPAADGGNGGFWCGNWSAGNLHYYLVSRTGANLRTITNTAITGTYGLACDTWTPGGPFLWAFSQGLGAMNPQVLHQISIPTGLATGVTRSVKPDLGMAATDSSIAGGLFISSELMPGFVIMGGVVQASALVNDRLFGYELLTLDAGTLLPFNLTAPAAASTITSFPDSTTLAAFTWDTSRAAATYKWVFGSPVVPPRLMTVNAATNKYEVTLGQLDGILAGLGLNPGDSITGQWNVWAFRGNMPANDSLVAANGARAVKFKRGKPALTPFNLSTPVNATTIVTSVFNPSNVTFNWTRSGTGVTYRWKLGTTLLKENVALQFPSNGGGYDSLFTIPNSTLDALLGGMGIQPGASYVGKWTVYARSGNDSLKAVQTFDITLRRQAKGDVIVVYDSTSASGRISRDSITTYLASKNITFDLFNKGASATTTPSVSFRGYNRVIWSGEGTNVMSLPQKDSLKAYLDNPTFWQRSKLILFAEDIGYQLGRTGSSYTDLPFFNNYLGANYVLDRPVSGAAQRLVADHSLIPGTSDSTIGTWPDVLSRFVEPTTHALYRFAVDNSINAIGKIGTTWMSAIFGVDVESLRRSFLSPPGSAHARMLDLGILYVDMYDFLTPYPLAPSNLQAISTQIKKVNLTWVDNSNNETGFLLERKIGDAFSPSTYTTLAILAANTTAFVDTLVQDTSRYTYIVRAISGTALSPYSNHATVVTVIPVELVTFSAIVSDKSIIIEWSTATEQNNKGFEVERKMDEQWEKIEFISGKGTTTQLNAYSYTDKFDFNSFAGDIKYRLKQIDFDGTYAYSKEVNVEVDFTPKEYSMYQNYPNPFNPSTTIKFDLPVDSKVSLKIYNTLGQEVIHLVNKDMSAGYHQVEFNASKLNSGVYFHSIEAKGADGSRFSSVKKMLLMK